MIVFVTRRYCEKVGGDDESDSCKVEFEHARRHRSGEHMVAVLADRDTAERSTFEWEGGVGSALRGEEHVDMSSPDDPTHVSLDALLEQIRLRGRRSQGAPSATVRASGASTSTHVDTTIWGGDGEPSRNSQEMSEPNRSPRSRLRIPLPRELITRV